MQNQLDSSDPQTEPVTFSDRISLVMATKELFGKRAAIAMWHRQGLPSITAGRTSPLRSVRLQDLHRFIADRCERSVAGEVQASVLFRAYSTWAASNGVAPLTLSMFGRLMAAEGIGKHQRNVFFYQGISLRA